jgi:hypothetical protein
MTSRYHSAALRRASLRLKVDVHHAAALRVPPIRAYRGGSPASFSRRACATVGRKETDHGGEDFFTRGDPERVE